MSSLREIMAGQSVATEKLPEELPLIHTSRCELLESFANGHTIVPQHCDVFRESLTYLFYGRPAYRSSRGVRTGESIQLCPICFVFKPKMLSQNICRVFPCDTGAVATSRFAPDISPDDLSNLQLDPNIESAQRIVSLLFGSNKDYFIGKVISGLDLGTGSIATQFYKLLAHDGPAGYDDRKSAIEIQVQGKLNLKNQLLFVVLPREFLEEPTIRQTILYEWNCDPVTYPTFMGDSPAAYYSVVRHKVMERFSETTRI